jgi:hypothetical protein
VYATSGVCSPSRSVVSMISMVAAGARFKEGSGPAILTRRRRLSMRWPVLLDSRA